MMPNTTKNDQILVVRNNNIQYIKDYEDMEWNLLNLQNSKDKQDSTRENKKSMADALKTLNEFGSKLDNQ